MIVAIALAITLPLTVFKSESESSKSESFKGSDVLNEVPLIDSHNDLPHNLYLLEKNQLDNFDFDSDLRQNPKWNISTSFTDLPRIRQGKLAGQFWVAYTRRVNREFTIIGIGIT